LFTKFIKTKKFITAIKIIISLGVFVYLLSTIQFSNLIQTFLKIKTIYILPILILVFFSMLIRTFRWQIILRRLDINQPIFVLFKYNLIGSFFASVTPAKVGDFGRAYFIWKKNKFPADKSIFSVLVDRGLDVLTLLLLGLIAVIYFSKLFYIFPFVFLIFSLIIIIIFFAIIGQKHILNFLSKIFFKKISSESIEKCLCLLKSPSLIGKLVLITFFNWLLIFIQAEFLILALDQQITIFQISLLVSMVMLIVLIPITVSGFGTRELATVYFFSMVGIEPTVAISFSLLWTFFGIVLPALIGGVILGKV